ncbi:glycosyltransferase [Flavobacteriales bacterium]|nr:glycosyltransferase [Flavobacteriales bacterium]
MLKISNYCIGWGRIEPNKCQVFTPKVSVVVAVRNEDDQIIRLISAFKSQIYPSDNLEFVLVNDHSTDATIDLLGEAEMDNLQIVNMPEGEFGKKNAISMAVSIASGDIILASDADCSFSPNWVMTMVSYFSSNKVMLVSGPVVLHKKKGIFDSFQALEFISLISSGAGAIGMGNAIFCNGANMAYRKSIFLEVNDFAANNAVSGDDVFLLHSVKARDPNSIVFAKHEDAIVTTDGKQSIKGFISQRKRWTAKSSSYKDGATIRTGLVVLFTNVVVVFMLGLFLYERSYFNYLIYYLSVKCLVDLCLLIPALSFFKRKDLIKWVLPFELFYSFYIVCIVILSFINTFEWKGRIYKK